METEKTLNLSPEVVKLLPIRNEAMHFSSKAILAIKENTTWEQLTCVGYNPELQKLEAVVQIKQTTGYSGGLCTRGSSEYVRFFIDWGNGFEDVGLTGFKAYDIPDAPGKNHPLNYMVQLEVNDSTHRKLCLTPVLPRVRAILSWNSIPTTNPDQPVQFGNRLEARIQLKPKKWLLKDLLEVTKIKLSPEFSLLVSEDQPVVAKPVSLSLEELLKVNEKSKIPLHRTMHSLLSHATPFAGAVASTQLNPVFDKADLSKLDISWAELLKGYDKAFNTTYEELTCVGLNTDTNTLGAVIHLKKQSGYSGSLCQTGSTEYVAFWADWDNNGSFDYLGTTQVKVHDITNMPAEGLYYCVKLQVNPKLVKRCTSPNVVEIRAVMSWQTPPSTTDPNAPVYWGNRKEVKVQIKPGNSGGNGAINFHYHDIGMVEFGMIEDGLAFKNAAHSASGNRPFGGLVHIGGIFGAAGVHYKVEYSADGVNWLPARTGIQQFKVFNPLSGNYEIQSQNSPDGWYINPANSFGTNPADEFNSTLVDWDTRSLQGIYQIRVLYTLDVSHNTYTSTVPALVVINNIRYNANTAFHNYQAGGAVLSSAHTVDMIFDNGGGCISQPKGQSFSGKFKALHSYFSQAQLFVLPSGSGAVLSSGAGVTPPGGTLTHIIDALHTAGYTNESWQLNTAQMQKCGYALVLNAYERTIYDNSPHLPYASISIGFAVI